MNLLFRQSIMYNDLDEKVGYDDRAVYVIGGLENESKVNYAMPVKALILDMPNYTKQIREAEKSYKKQKEYGDSNSEFLSGFHKEDKLIPVITLTIHFGNQKWNGPRNIREMFSETDPRIMRSLPDYEINLISPNEIDDFSDFDSDLGVVLSYIKASVDKKELRDLTSSDERFQRVERDAFHVLNEATDSKLKMIVKEGKIDVCTAIKEIREEGREEGRLEGVDQNRVDSIRSIMETLKLTAQQAMDALKIPAADQAKYMARL